MRRIYVLSVCLLFSFRSFADNKAQSPVHRINWTTIWLSFFFGVLFTILWRFLNRRTKVIDQRSDAGQPMNGWVIFLGACLIVRILVQVYFFWTADYFLTSKWIALGLAGGIKFHSLFIFELFLSLFALSGTGALIYWFFGRRDIFPIMFLYYVCFYIISNLILLIVYRNMPLPAEMITIRHDMLIQMIRIGIAAAWAGFVLKSGSVKRTFVYPPQ